MALDLGIFLEGAQSTFKVKVSENDQQAQYLLDKLISSDGSVTITETNDGGVETIDLTSSSASPLTTKGDLYTYSTTDARLGVGTDGQALIADSAEATGLRWGTVSADNMATADLTLTGDRTHDFNGNDLIFQTGQSNKFRIWNGTTGNIENGLAFWDAGSAYMNTSFYTWNLLANNGTRSAVRFLFTGETSFGYDVRFSSSSGNFPAANTRVHITGNGATSSTTSLLVENSTATQLLKIDDNGGFALGKGATYSDYRSVTIGNGATTSTAGTPYSIAIGNNATSTGLYGIAIGGSSNSGGGYNVVIGYGASASSTGSAIGYGATATAGSSLAVGSSASSGPNGTSIGHNATNNGYGVAVGRNSSLSSGGGGLALGTGAQVTGNYSMIFSATNFGSGRTNSTSKTAEFYLNAVTPTFRFGETADGWLNSTGGFVFGATSVDGSAALQVDSTTKGFLPPRMTTTEKNAISTPATGLVVFDSTLAKLCVYTGAAWETVISA